MAVSLKCLLALLCLGIFCQSSAYSIRDEAKVSQKHTAEILREIEEELERQYKTDDAEDNEARNFDAGDEAEMKMEIEDQLATRDLVEEAVDDTPETFEADDEAELLAMNKAIAEGKIEQMGLNEETSKMAEEDVARQIDEAGAFDSDDMISLLNMNKGEKEERSLDKRGVKGVHVQVSTPNRYEYTYVPTDGIQIVKDNTVLFGVEACNDAHVRLYSEKSGHSNYYHIIIGAAKNSHSRIKVSGKETYRLAVHKPLSCTSKHYFWATWTKEGAYYKGYHYVLRVGRGLNPGLNKFMEYTGSFEIPVNYVAVSTGFGSTGKWTFYSQASVITTENKYHYLKVDDMYLAGANSVTFWVRACNDAHILLMEHSSDYDRDIYEIVLGAWANRYSVIRDKRLKNNRALYKHEPLSCGYLRPFWMSWDKTTLHVGSGTTVGSGEFLSYKDPTPIAIKYLAVSTGWGATGKWIFE